MRIDRVSLMERQVAEEGVTYGAGLLVQGFSIHLLLRILFTQKENGEAFKDRKWGKNGLLIIDN